jgi:hypothetical protein
MNRIDPSTPSARSWRDIPQQIAPEAMSKVGRRRLTFGLVRTIALVVGLVVVAAGGFEIWRTLQNDPQRLVATSASEPLKHVTVATNGVLNEAWVVAQMALPESAGLMDLDLYALRTKLTRSGQVRAAVLTREFPDTLKVVLDERSPIVRVKARLDGPDVRDFLVSRDGTVFNGHGFTERTVSALPWLGGIRLLRNEAGFLPLENMNTVADLLVTARGNAPDLFATWRVVTLDRMGQDGEIEVQSSVVPKIIFGTREGFYSQIARLDLILAETRSRNRAPVKSINLAIGAAQVPVALMSPTAVSPGTISPTVRFPLN